ncbi:cyclin-D1-binding protein 1 homolog [Trichonephila inaurata madagascariensis]|uniref:Cyclin-D1-binding protein 1 homolog n=1 Tax=Trichonephila inaurata madagascariensis TaxID=2747483 RepID=A0A8X6Y671_9ARAC|nr:cyclin-D1-binding protein 1 homolog [Trichonephila inaurata madagascariensis]
MANSSSGSLSIRNILERFENNLDFARRQLLEDPPERENVNFDMNNFWTNFIGATKLISHEATKFCMAFDAEGITSIEACQSLIDKIEKTCLALLAVFTTLPKTKGKNFYKKIVLYSADILQRMGSLCAAIRNQSSSRLQIVGEVWEKCEAVEQLPRDNRDAVLSIFHEQHDMVQDASQELMDSLENEEEILPFELSLVTPVNGIQMPPVQSWTDSDRNVLLPCSGLIKALKACIKKSMQAISERGDGSNEACINELDTMAEIVKSSSTVADDFVLSLYPPVNHSAVREQATLVKNTSKELLTSVKNSHICITADETWIEFLEKAVDHNWVRIHDMVLAD